MDVQTSTVHREQYFVWGDKIIMIGKFCISYCISFEKTLHSLNPLQAPGSQNECHGGSVYIPAKQRQCIFLPSNIQYNKKKEKAIERGYAALDGLFLL